MNELEAGLPTAFIVPLMQFFVVVLVFIDLLHGQWDQILKWARSLRAMLLLFWGKILGRVRGYRGAVHLYAALLRWGRHSGLRHVLKETPTEYGLRLKHQFPAVKREIELIIETFNRVVYGETFLSQQQLATAQLAWHRLLSPLHWSSRLRSWFLQPGDKGARFKWLIGGHLFSFSVSSCLRASITSSKTGSVKESRSYSFVSQVPVDHTLLPNRIVYPMCS